MRRLARIIGDCRGAGLIEFAIILPVLVLFIYGVFVFGQLFQANAGMQHALGEGARQATLCLNPTPAGGCVLASDSEIEAKMNDAVFAPAMGEFTVNAPVHGAGFVDLSVTYTMPMEFIFFSLPDVTLTQTKRVYTA